VPSGFVSQTGLSGLTLGGGFGWLTRKRGLTSDHLVNADVVTANGELVRASENENPDLFWGIRGGGGNFGIVASWQFRMRALGPTVLAGVAHPMDRAGGCLVLPRDQRRR
jgi:FAD/FMN-containing dehydrogenase